MPSASHVLIVNGRKVQQPVFVVGAPHSGTSVIARALKRSEGFHLTIGQGSVLRVVYAFARRPSMHHRPGPGRRDRHQGRLRARLADQLPQLPRVHRPVPRGHRPRRRALHNRARAGPVRRRDSRPRLLRRSPERGVPRRPDHPGHQGRPRRRRQHAQRPRRALLVQAQLRQRRQRVPQPVLRDRERG